MKSDASLLTEMAEMRQYFFCFFTIFSISPDHSIAVFDYEDDDEWEEDSG